MKLTIATPEEMEALGATISRGLHAGDLVALNGELGAGKTTLVRGLGAALGVRGTVASPTFVIARTHIRGSDAPLVHVDAYRLSTPAEFDDLDIDFDGSIVVVEWAAGMIEGVADSWLGIDIVRPATGGIEESEPREVTITGHGPRFADFKL